MVGTLTSFTVGTAAVATEVNGNFSAVKSAVDDNHACVAALEARVAALEALLSSVPVEKVSGNPTVRFTGVNVHVVNGLNSTDTINGVGNLIVGYDEVRSSGNPVCSIGPATDTAACAAAYPIPPAGIRLASAADLQIPRATRPPP